MVYNNCDAYCSWYFIQTIITQLQGSFQMITVCYFSLVYCKTSKSFISEVMVCEIERKRITCFCLMPIPFRIQVYTGVFKG